MLFLTQFQEMKDPIKRKHCSRLFNISRFKDELENKIMTNSALSVERLPESVHLSVGGHSSSSEQPKVRFRFRAPVFVNVFIIILVGLALGFIEFDVIPTKKLGYYCRDPALSFPFTGDTISAVALILGSFLGPLAILAAVEFRITNPKFSVRIIWKWYRELLIGIITVLVITEVMKAIVGEQRPHFISTCKPNTEETCNPGEFITEYSCTSDGYSFYFMGDSLRSFPSGHTSISIYASIYCAVFIHYRFKTRKIGQLMKPLIITIILSWGAICGLTRITDRRHHWWDVLAGAVLGLAGAVYTIVAIVNKFEITIKDNRSPRQSPSTTTLIDKKNKSATSVVI